MKHIILSIILVSTFWGCKDKGTDVNAPAQTGLIMVNYESGFEGDSIIVLSDYNILIRDLASSDSTKGDCGCQFYSTVGFHQLEIILPIQNIHSLTYYIANHNYLTKINAYCNRNQNVLTTNVAYIE